jgi:hypothetical protein
LTLKSDYPHVNQVQTCFHDIKKEEEKNTLIKQEKHFNFEGEVASLWV